MATTPLPKYAKIKNNYCVGYYGTDNYLLRQLLQVKKKVEQTFPGLNLYIVCEDEKISLFDNEINIYPKSKLQEILKNVAFYRVLKKEEDIEELLSYCA